MIPEFKVGDKIYSFETKREGHYKVIKVRVYTIESFTVKKNSVTYYGENNHVFNHDEIDTEEWIRLGDSQCFYASSKENALEMMQVAVEDITSNF